MDEKPKERGIKMAERKIKEIKTISCVHSIDFERGVNKLINEGYELKNSEIREERNLDFTRILWCAILQK